MFFKDPVDPYDGGLKPSEVLTQMEAAIENAMQGGLLVEKLTSIQDQVYKLQKNIGGVVDTTGQFTGE